MLPGVVIRAYAANEALMLSSLSLTDGSERGKSFAHTSMGLPIANQIDFANRRTGKCLT